MTDHLDEELRLLEALASALTIEASVADPRYPATVSRANAELDLVNWRMGRLAALIAERAAAAMNASNDFG